MQHLPRTHAAAHGLVGLDVRHGAGLPAPGVVNEQLRVHAKEPVEQILAAAHPVLPHGTAGDVPHGEQPVGLQLPGIAPAHPPEVRQRTVRPQLAAVAQLRQFRHAHTVLVRRGVLGQNVQGHLAQVQVGADARRGGDAGLGEDLLDDGGGELPGVHAPGLQVGGGVDEHLVDGIDVDVLRRGVAQVDAVNLRAAFHVAGHAGRGADEVQRQAGIPAQLLLIAGGAGQPPPRGRLPPAGVDGIHLLDGLEQPRPARHTVALQRGGHRQADGLLGPALVRHHQMGDHRIQPPIHAFHGCIKGFQVNGDINPLLRHRPSLP